MREDLETDGEHDCNGIEYVYATTTVHDHISEWRPKGMINERDVQGYVRDGAIQLIFLVFDN